MDGDVDGVTGGDVGDGMRIDGAVSLAIVTGARPAEVSAGRRPASSACVLAKMPLVRVSIVSAAREVGTVMSALMMTEPKLTVRSTAVSETPASSAMTVVITAFRASS